MERHVNTGIYIRAKVHDIWCSVDIGDPELDADQLLKWLIGLNDDQVLRTMRLVRLQSDLVGRNIPRDET